MYWQLSKNTWFCDVTITVCNFLVTDLEQEIRSEKRSSED